MLKKMKRARGSYAPSLEFKLLCEHTDCKYVGNLGNKKAYCNYMEIEGHSRPCKPTPECTCYSKGAMIKVDHQLCIERH